MAEDCGNVSSRHSDSSSHERGYTPTLLADQETSDRYGVDAIPHTVVIDREGRVRHVLRGGNVDLERLIAPLLR